MYTFEMEAANCVLTALYAAELVRSFDRLIEGEIQPRKIRKVNAKREQTKQVTKMAKATF